MSSRQPVWEVRSHEAGGRRWWFAHLLAANGRIVVTTETYTRKRGALRAIAIADPDGRYEIREVGE